MIIPLTPIEEAWGTMHQTTKIETPSSRSVVKTSIPDIRYVDDDNTSMYTIPKNFVPNTLDVTLKDKNTINRMLPLTSNKRTELISELIYKHFKPHDYQSGNTQAHDSSAMNMESSKNKKTEYFKHDDQNQTVDIIIVLLLLYILIDKFMTIWSRS